MVLAFPAAARSTSRTICPRFNSGTTKALVWAASSRILFSGKGHAVIRRSLPTFNPDRKSTRLNSSHLGISYAVFCLKKNPSTEDHDTRRPNPRCRRLPAAGPPREPADKGGRGVTYRGALEMTTLCCIFFFFNPPRPPRISPLPPPAPLHD